ncbi:MAG: CAP domain-containing protein [Defluviitaleaceae bacterium]|nr:CAP domain-containing protein [Defluviitaleaceae bacterium]
MRLSSIMLAIASMALVFIFMLSVFDMGSDSTQQQAPEPSLAQMPSYGWAGVLFEPTLFSSEEIDEMLANAPHYSQTRPTSPHPDRAMTNSEREEWIADYYYLGGLNAQELEMYKIINEIRAEHDLPPFILCPRLSMAARLFSYLQVTHHSSGHTDPYYTTFSDRIHFFGVQGRIYMENANSERWYEKPDGSIEYIYQTPRELIDGWLSSQPHREHILTTDTTHVGFGIDSGRNRVVPTMKSCGF